MKSLERYVEATLDQKSAEVDFLAELSKTLEINPKNIKRVSVENRQTEQLHALAQVVLIDLRGTNVFKSENLQKIKGLTIITPRTIEIEVGEILL